MYLEFWTRGYCQRFSKKLKSRSYSILKLQDIGFLTLVLHSVVDMVFSATSAAAVPFLHYFASLSQ